MRRAIILIAAVVFVSGVTAAHAAHPLITDDTGTQGTGKFQLEINGGLGWRKAAEQGVSVHETGSEAAVTLSGGLTDRLDLVVSLPFSWTRTTQDGIMTDSDGGISDLTIEAKWRIYEGERLSLAIKPGISIPTGDESRGLGNGRSSYGSHFISSLRLDPVNVHLDLGYARNEFRLDSDRSSQRRNIFHGSLAATMEVAKGVQLVADIGSESNPSASDGTWASYLLGGAIWSPTDYLDLDLGVKCGLTRPEADIAVLAGVTCRF